MDEGTMQVGVAITVSSSGPPQMDIINVVNSQTVPLLGNDAVFAWDRVEERIRVLVKEVQAEVLSQTGAYKMNVAQS